MAMSIAMMPRRFAEGGATIFSRALLAMRVSLIGVHLRPVERAQGMADRRTCPYGGDLGVH
jgi:hypothetical protein